MTTDSGPGDRSYDAVLFDFGGVFMDSPFAAAETAAAAIGVPFETLTTGPEAEPSVDVRRRVESARAALLRP